MTKISGQFLISGQFKNNFKISGISRISGQLGALKYLVNFCEHSQYSNHPNQTFAVSLQSPITNLATNVT